MDFKWTTFYFTFRAFFLWYLRRPISVPCVIMIPVIFVYTYILINQWLKTEFVSPYKIRVSPYKIRVRLPWARQSEFYFIVMNWLHRDYCRPQTSLGQGNVFTPVCHSVHRMGMSVPTTLWWMGRPPSPELEADTLPVLTSSVATKAGGTHATGMRYWC